MEDDSPFRKTLGETDVDLSETYEAQSRALGQAGWDDPAMDIYNEYDAALKTELDLS